MEIRYEQRQSRYLRQTSVHWKKFINMFKPQWRIKHNQFLLSRLPEDQALNTRRFQYIYFDYLQSNLSKHHLTRNDWSSILSSKRIQGIISVRVVREPDQCTGRQDVRNYSMDSINELIDQDCQVDPVASTKN